MKRTLVFLATLSLVSLAFTPKDIGKRAEKVFDEALDKDVQTKVSVKRGQNVLTLDLANPQDVAKIKAGETLQLEEGRYTGLGGLKLKGLRFVGKGRDKTFISSKLKDSRAENIPLNHFEFWDLTLVNNLFTQTTPDNLYLIGVRLAGDNETALPQGGYAVPDGMVVYLSYAGDTAELAPQIPFGFTYTHNSLPPEHFALKEFRELDTFLMGGCYSKQLCPGIPEGSIKRVLEVIPKVKQELSSLTTVDARKKAGYLEGLARFKAYVIAHSGEAAPPAEKGSEYDKLVAKADAALKKKRDFAALLYLDAANQITNSAYEAEVGPKISEINNRLKKELGCHFKAEGYSDTYRQALQTQMASESPLVAMGGDDSKCFVKVMHFESEGQTAHQDGKILAREGVYQEKDDHREERQAKEQAAWAEKQAVEKAADRARQLRVDAATEKMTDTARKMEAGRVRVEGNQMTYGSGNFTGQASAGTQAALERAETQARGGKGTAQGPSDNKEGYVKVGENLKLASKSVQESTQVTKAWVEIQGTKAQEVSGAKLNIKRTRDCIVKRQHGGQFEDAAECGGWTVVGNMPPVDYVKTHLYRPVMTVINDKLLKSAKTRALASVKSADPEEQMDAKLRAMALGQAAYADLSSLTKKVTGVELKDKEGLAQVLAK